MFGKRNKNKEETPEYQAQKKSMEETTTDKVSIGTPTIESTTPTLEELVLGMTDTEYRTQILALILEIRDATKPKL